LVWDIALVKSTHGGEELNLDMINKQLRTREQDFMIVSEVLQLDASDLATLKTFQTRTVITIGSEESVQLYRRELVKLGCQVRTNQVNALATNKIKLKAFILDAHDSWHDSSAHPNP
jgi:hypothetical protein